MSQSRKKYFSFKGPRITVTDWKRGNACTLFAMPTTHIFILRKMLHRGKRFNEERVALVSTRGLTIYITVNSSWVYTCETEYWVLFPSPWLICIGGLFFDLVFLLWDGTIFLLVFLSGGDQSESGPPSCWLYRTGTCSLFWILSHFCFEPFQNVYRML